MARGLVTGPDQLLAKTAALRSEVVERDSPAGPKVLDVSRKCAQDGAGEKM